MISRRVDLKNMLLNALMNRKEELTIYELLDFSVQYFGDIIPFKEPDPNNMLEESEEDVYSHDTRIFSQYIGGIENGSAPLLDCYEYDEYIVKYKYNEKEVILGATFSEINPLDEYSSCFTSTIIVPIDLDRRGHAGTVIDFTGRHIVDYGEKLEEYDLKYAEEYKGYFSDKLPKIKAKENHISEKYVFSEVERFFLEEIVNEFKIPVSVVLKDGYLCIDCIVAIEGNYADMITSVIYFLDFVSQIIDRYSKI